jgi:3-hydroxybutyryl-CoA dehydrogenase
MAIKNVFVIGAGQMGNGIAQVSAQAGYDVVMSDIKEEFIQKGLATIEKSLDRLVKKETIKESDKTAIMARIKTTVDNKDAKDADMVIEAAPEILELKKNIFKQLEEICKPDAILATNTSSLPIGEIAAVTKTPGRVIGIHFMNPVPVMRGVEVIPGRQTTPEVLEAAKEYVKKIGKVPIPSCTDWRRCTPSSVNVLCRRRCLRTWYAPATSAARRDAVFTIIRRNRVNNVLYSIRKGKNNGK